MQDKLGSDGTLIDAKNWPEHFYLILFAPLYICILFPLFVLYTFVLWDL